MDKSIITELRNAVATISAIADKLEEQLVESLPPLTLEAVRTVLADKARAGHTAEIRELLQKYGADRLSDIDPVNYKALLTDAKELTDAT